MCARNPDQLSDPTATTPDERHHPTIPPSCSQDRQGSGADDCLGEWSAMGLVAKQITNESSDVAAEPENSPSVDGLTTGTRNPYYLGKHDSLILLYCSHRLFNEAIYGTNKMTYRRRKRAASTCNGHLSP